MAENQKLGPDATSSEYEAMRPLWRMVDAINGGAPAMRAAGTEYLPKFADEGEKDYQHRVAAAPLTNLYSDISRSLAAKPFAREVKLGGTPPDDVDQLCEDIDGEGNNLHVFAESVFALGIDKAWSWIFVDHTKVVPAENGRPRTVAEEREAGARPLWVHIPADRMKAAYRVRDGVRDVWVHARIDESCVEQDGYGERTVERIRILDRPALKDASGRVTFGPATYRVEEKKALTDGGQVWEIVEGPAPLTIGVIPLVRFQPDKRKPPLRDLAWMQVEGFQQEANLKHTKEMTCFPMLAGQGVRQPKDDDGKAIRVPVGPRSVLFSEPDQSGNHGTWEFLEPGAESIKTLMQGLDDHWTNMRDLGMQPLTKSNITVITSANVSKKANSALQAWTIQLKDALEQAFVFTAMWLGDEAKAVEVDIHDDFSVDLEAGAELASVLNAEKQRIISKRTAGEEMQRRGVLSANWDPEREQEQLADEGADPDGGGEDDGAIDPRTGRPIGGGDDGVTPTDLASLFDPSVMGAPQ